MGKAGVRSGHVVQASQPRASPPLPPPSREEGFVKVEAPQRQAKRGASAQPELSLGLSAEVGSGEPGAWCSGRRRPWRSW